MNAQLENPAAPKKMFFERLRVLHIEDSDEDALLIAHTLKRETEELQIVRIQSEMEMRSALQQNFFDIVICDHDLPGFSDLDALAILNERELDIPFIVVTGAIGGEEAAVELMRNGASDYVPKDKLERLSPAIRREVREASIRFSKREADEALIRKNKELEETIKSLTRTQEELIRADRLKVLGQMVSGLTLNFNNTLSKILGVVEIIGASQTPAIEEYVTQLREHTLEAADLVKRLQHFHSTKRKLAQGSPLDINEVLQHCIDLTQPRWAAGECSAQPSISLDRNLGAVPDVLGDYAEIVEAITNLIFNACDAMPEGGKLSINSLKNTRAVVVEISDTGVGMCEETLRNCAIPFFTTKGENGSGFGLAWVDGMMQRYGGVMRIRSQLGSGTTVQLRFPISDPNSEESTNSSEGVHAYRPLRIMVVEDETMISNYIRMTLEADHHQVEAFENGFKALERLREERFDVVIADRAMPEIKGDELVRRIRDMKGNEKIVMATGVGDLMIANCEIPCGVDLVLPKPITRDALRRALNDTGAYLTS